MDYPLIVRVHFDTNIFDHIHKRLGVTDEDLRTLRRARHQGRLELQLHLIAIEEIVNATANAPLLARDELKLVLGLCR